MTGSAGSYKDSLHGAKRPMFVTQHSAPSGAGSVNGKQTLAPLAPLGPPLKLPSKRRHSCNVESFCEDDGFLETRVFDSEVSSAS